MAYTDSFTYSNGELSTKNSTWVDVGGFDFNVSSNQLAPADTNQHTGYLYNNTFNSKHYSSLIIAADGFIGPGIRMAAGPDWYYCYAETNATTYNGEMDDGSPTDWDGGQTAPDTNGLATLAVDASTETTIYYKIDGVTETTYTSKSTLSGGKGGVVAYDLGTTARGDDWEGGDIGGGVTTYPNVRPLGMRKGQFKKVGTVL